MKTAVKNVIQLTGSGTTKEKREVLQRLHKVPAGEPLVIVATGQYVGEGFDYPPLDTLFLALPISWKGRLEQYAGRLHRENDGKNDVRIYDYIDIHEPVCDSMYHKRLRGYAAIGYQTIQLGQPSLFDNVELMHRIRPQYLITIAPAIDGFVLDCAIEQGVDTKQFGIPSELKGFAQMSKSVTSNTDPRFKALFAAIKDNVEIKALKMSLKYMCEEQYRVTNEVLRAMIEY